MAKFHGSLGFIEHKETSPGVFEEVATELPYTGDVLLNSTSWERGEGANDDLNVSNRFSIIIDPHALGNIQHLRYILWNGTKWRIKNVDVQRPRLVLAVGGVYNV